MSLINITITDESGFITSFQGDSIDIQVLRLKAVRFIDSTFGTNEACKIKVSGYVGYKAAFEEPSNGLKIPAIKAVRAATGYALKEAKDVVDALETSLSNEVVLKNTYLVNEANQAAAILSQYFKVEIIKA